MLYDIISLEKREDIKLATRKTASKTSRKATIDFDWDVNKKSSKRSNKKTAKQLKKLGIGAILGALILLVVGAVGGYFGVKFITRKDCFVINGKDEITLQIGESYVDEGVKVIAFGKDETDKVEIETNLTKKTDGSYYAEEVGTYYIAYKVNNLKYGSIIKVQKIRLITFVEVSEGSEYEK